MEIDEMSTVVHVGYQKTATTALQRTVFPRLPDCVYLNDDPDFVPFTRSVENDEDDVYDAQKWRALLEAVRRPGHMLLISREDFTKARIRRRTAERLHALLPDARILLCVRNQATIIPSLYSQHLKGGGHISFEAWLDRPRLPGWLEWDKIVALYREHFGVAAVKVMAYEHLRNDLRGFVTEACSFITPGTSIVGDGPMPTVNKGLAPPSRWVFRKANRLFRASEKNPRPLVANEVAWRAVESFMYRIDPVLFARWPREGSRRDRALVEGVLPRFRESNARLAAMTGLPLAEYGYALPA